MGMELVQVLPLSAFEGGELRALKDAAALLHGLVREGAQILVAYTGDEENPGAPLSMSRGKSGPTGSAGASSGSSW